MSEPTFAERVAIYLAPAWYAAAHPDSNTPTAAAASLWVDHVAEVVRTLRAAAVVGAGLLHEQTLTSVTGMTEGDLLIALATHHDRPDVAELLEGWLAELRVLGPDGRPLHEDPTGVHAVVVHLSDRTRRTS